MLTILHTADLHLGHVFGQFDADTGKKLSRARLEAVDTILGVADQYDVAAVLCAGDTFDSPTPDEDWWKGLAATFERRNGWQRPLILLPGNHDPLKRDSVYERGHPFRRALPSWVHVVDRDEFELPIGDEAVVYARPCRSTAGADDLALALPSRASGDERIRIGLVHGSTFDLPDFQTNFPISREAPRQRGLDYLAIGDVHGFRVMADDGGIAPIVYPGSPEPTRFGEHGAGHVAVVTFRRRGTAPRIRQERVGRWTWREDTVTSLAALRSLATEHLTATALRIHLDMSISVAEEDEVNTLLAALTGTLAVHGRAGAIAVDRRQLRVEVQLDEVGLEMAPETVREVALALRERALSCDKSRRALVTLYRLMGEVQ